MSDGKSLFGESLFNFHHLKDAHAQFHTLRKRIISACEKIKVARTLL